MVWFSFIIFLQTSGLVSPHMTLFAACKWSETTQGNNSASGVWLYVYSVFCCASVKCFYVCGFSSEVPLLQHKNLLCCASICSLYFRELQFANMWLTIWPVQESLLKQRKNFIHFLLKIKSTEQKWQITKSWKKLLPQLMPHRNVMLSVHICCSLSYLVLGNSVLSLDYFVCS